MRNNKTQLNVQLMAIFMPLLTTLFVILKLTGHISWPWLWVLSPMWLPVAVLALIALVIFISLKVRAI